MSRHSGLHGPAQSGTLSQNLFEEVHWGDLRFRGGKIFPLYGLVHFVPMHGNVAGRVDSDLNGAGTNAEYRHLYFVSDNEAFVLFSRKY